VKFNSDKAFKQLMNHGIVATMRFNRYRKLGKWHLPFYARGNIIVITRHGRAVGEGIVVDVVPNTKKNREKYLHLSGFKSVEEWEQEARRLHRGRLPNSIVIVRLLS